MRPFRAGLEIHQQLDTGKLFCRCPSGLREEVLGRFERRLRISAGELGEIDEAARLEALKGRTYVYEITDNTCLVEMDEEPPHEPDPEALRIALTVALMMRMRVLDEIQWMRKIVVDGSDVSGFQRTGLVAVDGAIETEWGPVRIQTLCLEEESARKIREEGDRVVYRLDRMGIPLLEIATAPEIRDPQQLRDVARRIGYLLRATGRVRRGLGTIRQDVNVSVEGGARIEIKGVQELDMLPTYLVKEVERQEALIKAAEELRRRGAWVGEWVDVTEALKGTRSRILRRGLSRGMRILALPLRGFSGLLKGVIGPALAEYARAHGLGGIVHTDELPGYGITEEEVGRVREALGGVDAFALAVSPPDHPALERIRWRAQYALRGVPRETRRPLPDGRTEYMRPLPGGARMYPETDVPPTPVPRELLEEIAENLPPTIEEKIEQLSSTYGISRDMASRIVDQGYEDLMVRLSESLDPRVVGRILAYKVPELRRKGADPDALIERLPDVMERAARLGLPREGIEEALEAVFLEGRSVEEAMPEGGGVDVDAVIEEVIRENMELVEERGEWAFKPLMGEVMKRLRGRVSGKIVAEKLKKKLEEIRTSS